ncbi:DEAD/DEAH box helicase [Lichenibacterium dinghuense]|uniref:DEAD/DEAH box helicase n=1 Tax=Lichenibacterium dinghuense TaxID=2895977 RepID=UPI001F1C8B02|nr:DEAD/DEAH box helicase family protein [Lichenibacterium sp. 6Y81]
MSDIRAIAQISARLSLRKPQQESLRRLAAVLDLTDPSKKTDVSLALDAVKASYPSVQDFERDFPSVCFALATGVGKTRCLGAFISYLFMTGKSRNFFVLAPNLTIYDKLLADFQPQSPKYVFRGVEAFAQQPPLIVNADNYEEGRGVRGADLLGREAAIINIFNISKINSEVRGGKSPRIKRLQEYIGDSYFNYLSELPDLVLLMDEAHRYRASAGVKAISELQPILGLELTATPKAVGAGGTAFKNVIYRYDLPEAMEDGYVKEPAVGTRANFDPKKVDEATLEQIKLEDGVHYHEHVKVQLQTYARQNNKPIVHPFMLVVASDIQHAERLKTLIESAAFFDGRYAGRVLTVHSAKSGEESEQTTQQLLSVETSGKMDVVIHVNKLKEGWDVTNLFTIVPLRAAASDILTEQTLGRGLRLPYGKRTGVEAVDTLTVIAHDRFNEIINAAKTAGGLIHKAVIIGEGGDVPIAKPVMVEAPSLIEQWIAPPPADVPLPPGVAEAPASPFTFNAPAEVEVRKAAYETVLPAFTNRVKTMADLTSPKVVREVAKDALAALHAKEGLFKTEITPERVEAVVAELCEVFAAKTIDIPQIVQSPMQEVAFWFEPFKLQGLGSWNYQPLARELKVETLREGKQSLIGSEIEGDIEEQPEDIIVGLLIDRPEIDYDTHSTLLYDLAGQVVARFRSYLKDNAEVRAVLRAHRRAIDDAIFAQMLEHMGRTRTGYRFTVTRAFSVLGPQTYDASAGKALPLTMTPTPLSTIKQFVFTGAKRGCFALSKFDSDAERRLAVLLDQELSVEKWMKPGPGQFRIEDENGEPYQPDFVVETKTEKLILEPKRKSEMQDAEVLRKTRSATLWCHVATEHHAKPTGGKPWRYALIPDDAIQPSATLAGLLAAYTVAPDMDLLGRFSLTEAA